jgi:HD-GYP domain-containing protein (c-di-GMP phosphodiesterase class II)
VTRLGGAAHSRRLYGAGSAMWTRTLTALHEEVERLLDAHGLGEVTIGLLGGTLAVCGVPVDAGASAVVRVLGLMRPRDVEIIALRRGVGAGEVEILLSFLSAELADVVGVRAETWLAERGAEHVSIKHLRWAEGDGAESFRDVYRRGQRVLRRELGRAREQGAVSAPVVSELARSLLDVITHAKAPVATLLALRERDDYGYVHAMNVSLLSTLMARALGLDDARAQEVGLAGLVHDLGHTRVPDGIVGKRARLTAEESQLLARHTHEGARILLETQGLDHLGAVAALTHHEPWSAEAPLAVELVKVADVFDQLRTLSGFDDALGARSAVAYALRRLPGRCSPFLLERLLGLVCPYDDDELVTLSTGEAARVVKAHPELALHPTVEVVSTAEGPARRGTVYELWRWTETSDVMVVPEVLGPLRALDPADLEALG